MACKQRLPQIHSINFAKPTTMTREKLETKIIDAADGLLSEKELHRLEGELRNHPDLLEDYRSIMSIPDMTGIYGTTGSHRNDISVHRILKKIEQEELAASFDTLSVTWFKKYALAASLLILAVSSLFYFTQPELMNGDLPFEELFYPFDEISGEDYVHYLNEWIDD
jgi:hypothetical protein